MLCRLTHGLQRRHGRRLRCRSCGELLQRVKGVPPYRRPPPPPRIPPASRSPDNAPGLHRVGGLEAGQVGPCRRGRGHIVFYLEGWARPQVWCVDCCSNETPADLAAHLERCYPGAEFVGAILTPDGAPPHVTVQAPPFYVRDSDA